MKTCTGAHTARCTRMALVAMLASSGGLCSAAAPITLTGTIGKAAVVLEVEHSGTSAEGRYFYRQHHADIPLHGAVNSGGALVLDEGATNTTGATATILLAQQDGASWRGTWTDSKSGKTLPVTLSALAVEPQALATTGQNSETAISAYDRERLRNLPLQRDVLETVSGRPLQWWIEPVSETRVFRVIGGYPASTLARINAWLAQEQDAAITQYFDCQANHVRSYGPLERSDFSFHATPHLLSSTVISVTFETIGECGGKAVNDHVASHNIDLRTMQELALTEVVWGTGRRTDRTSADFPSWLAATLTKLYPAEMADLRERCQFDDVEVWGEPHWSIRQKGLSLEPAFDGHKQAPCGGTWLLPWHSIARHPGPRTAEVRNDSLR
jgi:hypothetical protein